MTAGALLLLRLGISVDPTPILGLTVRLPDPRLLPYLLLGLMAYQVYRLVHEWVQSEPARRQRRSSRIDLAVTLLVALVAAGLTLRNELVSVRVPTLHDIPFWILLGGAVLATVGAALGTTLATLVWSFRFIRDREEARRLALPRYPVAVRATFRMGLLVMTPLVIVVLLLTPSLKPPLSYLWPWLLGVPMGLRAIGEVLSRLTNRWTPERLKRLQEVFDRHDTRYQLGGWDTQIPPHNTPLYQAAARGDVAEVRQLLQSGVDPNTRNEHGWTALGIAVAQGHSMCADALLDYGANPALSNFLGRSPLMFAARYGNADLVRRLVDNGADPNINESDDEGALSAAAAWGHTDVVAYLLGVGADHAAKDREGRTALKYAEAAGHGDAARLLRRASLGRDA